MDIMCSYNVYDIVFPVMGELRTVNLYQPWKIKRLFSGEEKKQHTEKDPPSELITVQWGCIIHLNDMDDILT